MLDQVPLRFICLRFHCRMREGVVLPAQDAQRFVCPAVERLVGYKGAYLHRAWGAGLKAVSSDLYGVLNPVAAGLTRADIPNPYSLLPPDDCLTEYLPGQSFNFQLTLFGTTTRLATHCIDAAVQMGRQGWGRPKGRFDLLSVERYEPRDGWQPILDLASGHWLGPLRDFGPQDIPLLEADSTLTLHFNTPLVIQASNTQIGSAPTFAQLHRAVVGRIQQLSDGYGGAPALDGAEKERLRRLAEAVAIQQAKVVQRCLEDIGPRQARPFRGLVGSITYEGDFTPFLPWLTLACLTQVGKKTGYGFGQIETGDRT